MSSEAPAPPRRGSVVGAAVDKKHLVRKAAGGQVRASVSTMPRALEDCLLKKLLSLGAPSFTAE